jgi:hypothetical protein
MGRSGQRRRRKGPPGCVLLFFETGPSHGLADAGLIVFNLGLALVVQRGRYPSRGGAGRAS